MPSDLRRFSITKEQGEVIKTSLLFTYSALSTLLNNSMFPVDKILLDKISAIYLLLVKYDWNKK